MHRSRSRLTPASLLAAAALFFALGGSALAFGDGILRSAAPAKAQQRCATGAVKGIAVVPSPGTLPGQPTSNPAVFSRRFNCTGRAVVARKVSAGVFEVRFDGLRVQTVIAGGLSPDVGSVNTVAEPDGSIRVIVRSDATEGNILKPFDLPFALVAF